MSDLYKILEWARSNGEIKAIDRIRIKVLALTINEQVIITQVTADTECSPELARAVAKAATDVVGSPCPVQV